MTTSVRSLARSVRRLAAASLASLALAPGAHAQPHLTPAGVSTVAAPPAAFTAGSRAVVRVDDRGDRVLDDAVTGTLIGLVAGAVYAVVLTGNSTDDSEDGLAFVVLMPVGALLGALVGTAVGLGRT